VSAGDTRAYGLGFRVRCVWGGGTRVRAVSDYDRSRRALIFVGAGMHVCVCVCVRVCVCVCVCCVVFVLTVRALGQLRV
jgi:hypothetical protein